MAIREETRRLKGFPPLLKLPALQLQRGTAIRRQYPLPGLARYLNEGSRP